MKSCASCTTENDDTRVFCLNCGVRLPESTQPSPSFLRTTSVGAAAPPLPVMKKTDRLRRHGKVHPLPGAFRFLMRMLPLGLMAACGLIVYLALQGNGGGSIPAASDSKNASDHTPVRLAERAPSETGMSTSGQPVPVPEPDPQSIRRSLAALQVAARSQNGAWSADGLTLTEILGHHLNESMLSGPGGLHVQIDSVTVALEEGRAAILLNTRWESLRLLCVFVVSPESHSGGLGARVVSGRIGRLPLPGPFASLLAGVFKPSLAKLGPFLSLAESAEQASISPKKLVIRWGSAGRS